jgi:hypothetical protein
MAAAAGLHLPVFPPFFHTLGPREAPVFLRSHTPLVSWVREVCELACSCERDAGEWFGEEVGLLLCGRDLAQLDDACCYLLLHVMVLDVDVLRAFGRTPGVGHGNSPVLATEMAVMGVLTGAFWWSCLVYALSSTRRTALSFASGMHISLASAVSQVMSRAARDTAVYSASDELRVTVRWRQDTQWTGAPFTVSSTPVTDRRVSLSWA